MGIVGLLFWIWEAFWCWMTYKALKEKEHEGLFACLFLVIVPVLILMMGM